VKSSVLPSIPPDSLYFFGAGTQNIFRVLTFNTIIAVLRVKVKKNAED
jgi:hypothetical protein